MPFPVVITDLSTTPGANNPQGNTAPFPEMDDHIRALASFIASIYANTATNGWVSPYATTAALSTYLPLSGGTVTGNLSANGNTALGDATADTLSVSGVVVKNGSGNWVMPAAVGGPTLTTNITRISGSDVTALVLADSVTGNQAVAAGVRLAWKSNGGGTEAAIGFEVGGDGTNNQSQITLYTQAGIAAMARRVTVGASGNVTIFAPISGVALTVAGGGASITGTVTATAFTGDGANLTVLNATNLASGTVPSARVAGAYTAVTSIGNTSNAVSFSAAGNVTIAAPASGTALLVTAVAGDSAAYFIGAVQQQAIQVVNLPVTLIGSRSFVSDATAATFGTIVAGGGTTKVPVYSDGTNWRIG